MSWPIQEYFSSNGIRYYQCGETKPAMIFLHGLLGSGKNWQIFVRWIAQHHNITAIAPDLRGHGQSKGFQGPATIQTLVDDIGLILGEITNKNVLLLGHSLGGKVAIQLGNQYPQYIQKLMIVDIPLDPIPPDTLDVLPWLRSLTIPTPDIATARKHLQQFTKDERLVEFLLTNLVSTDQGFVWRLDLPGMQGIADDLKILKLHSQWAQLKMPIWLIKGRKSEYLSQAQAMEMVAVKSPEQLKYIEMQNAGHWCHADEPMQFRKILGEFVG